jgi:dolichyl-diphosphooligosaccharide--protein glycosyltransferase/undecaprenyl-diphosphooligosaccharide--protein glycosyltransferase
MKENRLTLIYILVAYVFVFLFHLYWLSFASKIPEFYWHGQVMINNVDGYYYGSGAQKILYGMHKYNPRLEDVYSMGNGLMAITAYIAKFFHLSIDSVMLYLPAIVSSLVVVPIILIGRLYGNLLWGFLAALIGGIGWSFYNRTLVGYFDTDMFSVVLPVFVLYFLLASIKKESLTDVFVAVILAIIYPWVYGSGKAVLYSIIALYGLYLFVFRVLKNKEDTFALKAILLISIPLLPFNIFIQFLLAILIFVAFRKVDTSKYQKHLLYASFVAFLAFLFGTNLVMAVLKHIISYTESSKNVENLHFLNVAKTVREASHIPWYIVFDRIIGSSIGILFAIAGYLLLVKRYKEFIIALPLWGIGLFAFFGGLRFTVYAVPIAAISGVYFFIWLSSKVKEKRFQITIPIIGSIVLITPNITHIVGCCEDNKLLASIKKFYPLSSTPYIVPTTFKKSEVAVLDELRKKSNEKDYVITWWDYGYPIWYYADVNTLIDGGKHHEDNFIVSKILTTSNQYLAHNLGLLAIKEYIKTKKPAALSLFIKNNKPVDVNMFLAEVGSSSFTPPKLDRDVYLMLPYRMFKIFSTVGAFSDRNLNTGETFSHFFYFGRVAKGGEYLFVGKIPISLRGVMIASEPAIPIKDIYLVAYDKDGKLKVQRQHIRDKGINLILLRSYGSALLVDDYYFNSTFVQMFVFENYDKKLFEPVILNPWIKIYKYKQ